MLTIMTNVAMSNKTGIIGGVAALLIITLSIPKDETILYVCARVLKLCRVLLLFLLIQILIEYENFYKK